MRKQLKSIADALEHADKRLLLLRDAQSVTSSWLACANTLMTIYGDASALKDAAPLHLIIPVCDGERRIEERANHS